MSSFLILHGLANHRPPAHWQFWLAARLVAEGHFVLYPGLPDPDAPSLVAWQDDLYRHLGMMGGGDHTVICHSLACLLWFHSAVSITEELRPDRLLLVSPPDSDQVPDSGADFRLRDLDSEAVRSSVGVELRIVASDADPYNVRGAQASYGDRLAVDVEVVSGAGHITPDDGYGPWPEVESWCRSGRAIR